jgi:hypothetical protein
MNKSNLTNIVSAAATVLLLVMHLSQPAYAEQKSNTSAEVKDGTCDYYQAGQKHLYWGDLHVHTA